MHNIQERSLKTKVREMIGKTIRRVLQVADPEDDGAVSGNSRSQVPWWRKKDNYKGTSSNPSNSNSKDAYSSTQAKANMAMDYVEVSKPNGGNGVHRLEEVVVGLSLKDNSEGCVGETIGECLKQSMDTGSGLRKVNVQPLQDCSNQLSNSSSVESTRKWKKLAREVGQLMVSPLPMIVDRRSMLDDFERSAGKRQCLSGSSNLNKENLRMKEDKLLPRRASNSIIFPLPSVLPETRVSSLIDADLRGWKSEVINEMFLPGEASIIRGIPLSIRNTEDMVIWEEETQPVRLPIIHHQWRPPEQGYFKINFDAAVFKPLNLAGIGVVICDWRGEVTVALSMPIALASTVADLEALACRRAVMFAAE
nr:hypothetical protein CFP56_46909 [Quercus suber]